MWTRKYKCHIIRRRLFKKHARSSNYTNRPKGKPGAYAIPVTSIGYGASCAMAPPIEGADGPNNPITTKKKMEPKHPEHLLLFIYHRFSYWLVYTLAEIASTQQKYDQNSEPSTPRAQHKQIKYFKLRRFSAIASRPSEKNQLCHGESACIYDGKLGYRMFVDEKLV